MGKRDYHKVRWGKGWVEVKKLSGKQLDGWAKHRGFRNAKGLADHLDTNVSDLRKLYIPVREDLKKPKVVSRKKVNPLIFSDRTSYPKSVRAIVDKNGNVYVNERNIM